MILQTLFDNTLIEIADFNIKIFSVATIGARKYSVVR